MQKWIPLNKMIYIADKYLGVVSISHAKPEVICLSLFYVILGLYRIILLKSSSRPEDR